MIDVSMSDDDLLDLQIMLTEKREDILNLVTGVDDHGFACILVGDD